MEGLGAAAPPPRLERYTRMALHPKNGILIEAGFVFGRKGTNRGFAALVVRMHEAKDERPFANHIAILIPPLPRCLPDSGPSRKARHHRRGKKRRPLVGCDDAVWLRGPEVQQVSDRTLLARHAPGLAHGCASGRRGDKHGCRDDSSTMHSIQHGFAQAPRQYDFREVRLTPSALRWLAFAGQSRQVLEAHTERGGQPWKSLARPCTSVSMSTRNPSPSPTRQRSAGPRWCRWARSAHGSATSTS